MNSESMPESSDMNTESLKKCFCGGQPRVSRYEPAATLTGHTSKTCHWQVICQACGFRREAGTRTEVFEWWNTWVESLDAKYNRRSISDSERLDYLERTRGERQIWVDTSSGDARYSVDGGSRWHDDLRSAIDEAMPTAGQSIVCSSAS